MLSSVDFTYPAVAGERGTQVADARVRQHITLGHRGASGRDTGRSYYLRGRVPLGQIAREAAKHSAKRRVPATVQLSGSASRALIDHSGSFIASHHTVISDAA